MAEGLSRPDGTIVGVPVDVEAGTADHARMMAAAAAAAAGEPVPAAADEPAAPPKRAPRGEAPDGEKPRRGRPPKADSARTRDAQPGDAKPSAKAPARPRDYTADLAAIGDGLWLSLSGIPVTAPYAALVHMHQDGIVSAVNSGAQVNPRVRASVEKLTSGAGSAWMLQLGILGANIAMQAWSLVRDPGLRRQVAEGNAEHVRSYMEKMGAAPAAEAA